MLIPERSEHLCVCYCWRKLSIDLFMYLCVSYPSVVIVTIVYQNAAGIDVKLVPSTFFSA